MEKKELENKVEKPWGYYQILENGPGYQVKLISVSKNESLSLQKHHKRSEHWVVVSGKATVTVGDEIKTLFPNDATYIPVGVIHRIENRTREECLIVEIELGTYLGEDDIVRMSDKYGRALSKESSHR